MPQVTVYIRREDLPKWRAVKKKSAFMHKALKQVDIPRKSTEPEPVDDDTVVVPMPEIA